MPEMLLCSISSNPDLLALCEKLPSSGGIVPDMRFSFSLLCHTMPAKIRPRGAGNAVEKSAYKDGNPMTSGGRVPDKRLEPRCLNASRIASGKQTQSRPGVAASAA